MSDKAFSLTEARYDMSTYLGRCIYYYRSINPLMCLENEASIAKHLALLDNYRNSPAATRPSGDDVLKHSELWHAREVVEACVHPTTKEVIPPMFRMAAFIPTNVFILPFAMMPTTVASPVRTMGVQWFNQSYNALINYSNRSSDKQPLQSLLQGYGAAVTVSLAGALTGSAIMRRVGTAPSVASTLVRAIVPGLSMAFAGSANVAMMRRNEWATEGVDVVDEDGDIRGKSLVAGRDSLSKCAQARILWNIPCMLAPMVSTVAASRIGLLRRFPISTEAFFCTFALTLGVAPALAFYPTRIATPPSALEPQFHNLRRKNGEAVQALTYYKGL